MSNFTDHSKLRTFHSFRLHNKTSVMWSCFDKKIHSIYIERQVDTLFAEVHSTLFAQFSIWYNDLYSHFDFGQMTERNYPVCHHLFIQPHWNRTSGKAFRFEDHSKNKIIIKHFVTIWIDERKNSRKDTKKIMDWTNWDHVIIMCVYGISLVGRSCLFCRCRICTHQLHRMSSQFDECSRTENVKQTMISS